MELAIIPLDRLAVSALNMRASRKKSYLDDILPSIRERGVLVPLLVRPNGKENCFEIVAGRRRFLASKRIEKETGEARDLPCRVLAEGDDAAAVEASILENTARLEPDEMQEFEAFKKLNDKGKSVEEIARIFGVTELTVKRRLALASLIPSIRKVYAEDEIDGASITALTLASEAKQREWFEMFKSAGCAPGGQDETCFRKLSGSVSARGGVADEDFYKLDVETGGRAACLIVDIDPVDDADTITGLFDANREIITSNDDRADGDVGSRLVHELAAGEEEKQTFLLHVGAYSSGGGDYNLLVELRLPEENGRCVTADDYERPT